MTQWLARNVLLGQGRPSRASSNEPLCEPLVAELKDVGADVGAPQILNVRNGKPGKGAHSDYSKTLGDFSCLQRHAVTEAVVWRTKLADPARRFVSLQFLG